MAGHFDPRQVEKCHDRMDKAREALFHCRNASDLSEFASHWATFLIHTGSILNALDSGARVTPQGMQWYGGKKREGRSDQLVAYMHQARNAEEHGAEPVSAVRPFLPYGVRDQDTGVIDFDMGTDWGSGQINEDGSVTYKKDPSYKPNPRGKMVIGASPNGAALRPVTDKFKTTFWPPTEHLGRPLTKKDPISLADVYVAYLERLVDEAASMS